MKTTKFSKKQMGEIKWGVICLVVITVLSYMAAMIIVDIEYYLPTARNAMRIKINNGDVEEIEHYKSHYIERHKYLFDGPVTEELMAKQFGIGVDTLYDFKLATGSDTYQELYDEWIKDNEDIVSVIQRFSVYCRN